ncbi:NAD(P)-binding domain-containing protein [Kribbella sp. CA-294648]|uniref:NAD(P)-binding domain-containing protein n=1 Tax=Kribbella sp. CA-294648 TaxID=3239948 RepID=UPI003D90543C
MKRIGIIGVGEIGRAIVGGLYYQGDGETEVFLSPRGARTAAELSTQYKQVRVCPDNQAVVDQAEIVIIAVRRQDRHEALGGLTVPDDKIVVNVMAGVSIEDLRSSLTTDALIVRAIPLPAIRERRSVTVTCPSHPEVDSLFELLGGALPAADEKAFNVFSAVTGTLTIHFQCLATVTAWAAGHGIASDDADRYVRSVFREVGRALGDDTRTLQQLASDHETPGGSNERIRTTWFTSDNSAALTQALDGLLTDLG